MFKDGLEMELLVVFFMLRGIPVVLKNANIREIFNELLDQMTK